MYCSRCGAYNDDQAVYCSRCGAPLRAEAGAGPYGAPGAAPPDAAWAQSAPPASHAPYGPPPGAAPGGPAAPGSESVGPVGVVLFCFPLAGAVMYFVWKDRQPNKARQACGLALGGLAAGIALRFLMALGGS